MTEHSAADELTTRAGAAPAVSLAELSDRQAGERHVPVMLDRCLDLLAPAISKPGAVVIDGTLGMGGHSEAMLERFPELTLIGIDRDPQAHAIAGQRLARFGERFIPVHAVYDQIDYALEVAGVEHMDGILLDLGVSSMQLDERSRGFAYSYDAPLDMRMNSTDPLTAEIVVNEYSEEDLRRIIRSWGEEKFAGRIASKIVAARAKAPIRTTGELVKIIQSAVPVAAQRKGGHPAKRTFQALRIEVNHELEALERAVPAALKALALDGRFVAMSYHSLEDKIVKRALSTAATSTAPKGFPVELEEHKPTMKIITRGAEPPTEEEIAQNSRAASAKLRAAEKIKMEVA
ncbi:MAG: 16S rRNA (cytosine(1402)-N(4))-methyltransferase RsmH [Rothia sp. (in: high G+C Gram-positive bacteria)]|uniref:16S rRNA (cytosine(1402)-N(4))-methyltransferase RsmH n=1 Tax=Rothia sp. (in: high G+C Gram-positive bacteria) TaxID=1885016 RepID=UPI0026E10E56|nr:16S rRNA (cytosine(1402)-N(4))-methyltransferase RsmH [Rothia sp. (in: high G+C Gram-positive bacteria)]MDO5751090.1 16S rRNA (cytosine(1402)-N(4))-methyltransferase RsmH [Rothia sp. (in: high G+C Gram-positive bacteria)]